MRGGVDKKFSGAWHVKNLRPLSHGTIIGWNTRRKGTHLGQKHDLQKDLPAPFQEVAAEEDTNQPAQDKDWLEKLTSFQPSRARVGNLKGRTETCSLALSGACSLGSWGTPRVSRCSGVAWASDAWQEGFIWKMVLWQPASPKGRYC